VKHNLGKIDQSGVSPPRASISCSSIIMANESRCQREDCGFESHLLHQFRIDDSRSYAKHVAFMPSELTLRSVKLFTSVWPEIFREASAKGI
jgi:hypothetical protein